MTYYNEHDPKAAAWLRELAAVGAIPAGDVDTRSIADVRADDLRAYGSCHFFAGIGGWPYALRLAGWPDDLPVWTGSCPCQPFSSAGKQLGTDDERHLWPEFARLIAECHPPTVFGEQVASKLGRQWLAGVRADLEALGYGVGAADLCAAGVGAPHIRQRLYWVADAERDPRRPGRAANEPREGTGEESARAHAESGRCCDAGRLEHPTGDGREQRRAKSSGGSVGARCEPCGVGDTVRRGQQESPQRNGGPIGSELAASCGANADGSNPWVSFDVIQCRDGKARRFEPGSFPLAHGIPGRVGLLRGYGNAIVPQVAAEFIRAFCEAVTPGLALK